MKLVLSTIFFEYFLVLGKERLEHTLYKFYANMIPVRNGKSPLSTIIHVYEIIFTYTYAHAHTHLYIHVYTYITYTYAYLYTFYTCIGTFHIEIIYIWTYIHI